MINTDFSPAEKAYFGDELACSVKAVLRTDMQQLQMISPAALKLMELTEQENTRAEDLVLIIQTEPTLAARLLTVVNSASLVLPSKIQSLAQAINLLGYDEVRKIALEQLLYNQLIDTHSHKTFDQLFFWQHSLFVAYLAKEMANDLGYHQPETLYMAGLLHDIGKLVLENHGKTSYSDFLASHCKSDRPTEENERLFFGLSHVEIGYQFCQQWHLPAVITAVVAAHHGNKAYEAHFDAFGLEIAIVNFANYIAWLHGIGSTPLDTGHYLSASVSKRLDLSKLDFESLLQRVDNLMQSTGQFYGIDFPNIQKLRATLLFTAIKIGRNRDKPASSHDDAKPLSSLLLPHHSLNAQNIVLATLEAIQHDFGFDRVIMWAMSANRQGLIVKHAWPTSIEHTLSIPIDAIGGQLLQCLRNRTPAIIDTNSDDYGKQLLRLLQVDGFVAVPVLRNNRLVGILYADYAMSGKTLTEKCALQIQPVANEMGVALWNAKRFVTAQKQAELDGLTQLFNKSKINSLLEALYQSTQEELKGLAIGFVDIDHFKQFNDICGHQAGDDALKIVAEILRSMSRPDDFVGRYGGEEFVFALRHTTCDGAFNYAERMRLEIEKRGKLLSKRFNNLCLTASIGIALYRPENQNYLDHVKWADQAMYQAKHQGRNRVVMIESGD